MGLYIDGRKQNVYLRCARRCFIVNATRHDNLAVLKGYTECVDHDGQIKSMYYCFTSLINDSKQTPDIPLRSQTIESSFSMWKDRLNLVEI